MQNLIEVINVIYLFYQSGQDIKKKSVSFASVILFIGIALIFMALSQNPIEKIITGMFPGLFIILISRISKGAIGYGDGGILIGIGILTGVSKSIGILLAALILLSLYSLLLIFIGKIKVKQQIPFVPFLLAADVMLLLI